MKVLEIIKKSLLLIVIVSYSVFAGGTNRTPQFSARSSALDGLYFAGLDGVSNIFLNPAGLAFLNDKSFEFTGFLKSEQQIFSSDIDGLHRSFREDDPNIGAGIYISLSDDITLGLAVQSVYEYRVNWPYIFYTSEGNTAYTIGADMSNENLNLSVSPAIGYKLGDLSIGLAANIYQVQNKSAFIRSNDNWDSYLNDPVYQFSYDQSGYTWNINLGFMYDLTADLRVGVSIVNGVDATLKGDASSNMFAVLDSTESKVDVESNFQTPWRIGCGFLYQVTDNIKINIDARYNLYGSLDEEILYTYDNSVWQNNSTLPDSVTGFSIASVPLYYNNSIDLGVGFEYDFSSIFAVQASYKFSQSPNSSRTYNLLNPTVDRHVFAAGFGYDYEDIKLEGSVIYYRGVEKTVNDSDFEVLNGRYNTDGFIPTLTLKYKL